MRLLKISTKGRYGLKAMFELAVRYGEGPVLMSTLAKQQNVSRKYLHSLLSPLQNAGLTRSRRGVHGGYLLTRPPHMIFVSEVLEALEGPMLLVDCVASEDTCSESLSCPTRKLWVHMTNSLKTGMEGMTLSDLLSQETSDLLSRETKAT